MYKAPAVSYPVGRSLAAGRAAGAVLALGMLANLLFAHQSDGLNGRHGLCALAWMLVAVLAAWRWRLTPAGMLHWRAGQWSWDNQGAQINPPFNSSPQSDAAPALSANMQLTVHLDFQGFVLVRLQNGQPLTPKLRPSFSYPFRLCLRRGPVRWLWLERSRSPQQWSALRCALHAPTGVPSESTDITGSKPKAVTGLAGAAGATARGAEALS